MRTFFLLSAGLAVLLIAFWEIKRDRHGDAPSSQLAVSQPGRPEAMELTGRTEMRSKSREDSQNAGALRSEEDRAGDPHADLAYMSKAREPGVASMSSNIMLDEPSLTTLVPGSVPFDESFDRPDGRTEKLYLADDPSRFWITYGGYMVQRPLINGEPDPAAHLPAALGYDPDMEFPGTDLTGAEVLAEFFMEEMMRTEADPGSREYAERWRDAQVLADMMFKQSYGRYAYVRMNIRAAQSE